MPRTELIHAVWARAVVGTLASSGIAELVVSPGSRSTPLVAAAVELGVPCRSVVDERSAAFFAVGSAKVTGRPMALICTSGTAPAHYLPAVIEASQSGTPLVVVSADRPPELHGCQAAQTVDQQRMFGVHCRWFVDLGVPDASAMALRALVREVGQAVSRAVWPHAGPVHLNVPLRKPLTPVEPSTQAEIELDAMARAMVDAVTTHWPSAACEPSRDAVIGLSRACRSTPRGVIVLGPAPLAAAKDRAVVAELSTVTGFPVLAEATSQHRFHARAVSDGAAFDLLAGADGFDERLLPDLVVQLGAPVTAGAWGRMLDRHPEVERWVVAPEGWPDPHASATAVVRADPGRLATQVVRELGSSGATCRDGWKAAWADATDTAWRVVDEVLAEASSAGQPLGEGVAVRAVAAAVPDGAVLAASNGLPVRSLDWYLPPAAGDWDVWCQRGASGIDGIIAGVSGAAAVSGRPVVALVGDVAFAHDVASLAVARQVQSPLVLVVLNNNGGRIFELLPEAATIPEPEFARLWLTPSGLDPVAMAAAFGVRAVSAVTPGAVTEAVAEGCSQTGATLVGVPVAPSSQGRALTEIRRRIGRWWGG